jgi:hypothetical protein
VRIAWEAQYQNRDVMASQLWRLEAAIRQIQFSPNANPALLERLPQMQEQAQQLAVAVNADRILARLGNQIVSKEQERRRRAEHNARKAVERETKRMVAESMLARAAANCQVQSRRRRLDR